MNDWYLGFSRRLHVDKDVLRLVGDEIRRRGGRPLAAIRLSPLQSSGLALTLSDLISILAVGLVKDFLLFLLSFVRFGDLGRHASSALLRVKRRALRLSAMDNDALTLMAVLRVTIEVKVLLLDV